MDDKYEEMIDEAMVKVKKYADEGKKKITEIAEDGRKKAQVYGNEGKKKLLGFYDKLQKKAESLYDDLTKKPETKSGCGCGGSCGGNCNCGGKCSCKEGPLEKKVVDKKDDKKKPVMDEDEMRRIEREIRMEKNKDNKGIGKYKPNKPGSDGPKFYR